jgi:hypothetical protein
LRAAISRAVGIAQSPAHALDFAARAEAGMDEPTRLKSRQRAVVIADVLALPARRLEVRKAEPGEIRDNGGDIFAPTAGEIDVFDAQKNPAADLGRDGVVEKRRIGVTEMQEAVGRRREA